MAAPTLDLEILVAMARPKDAQATCELLCDVDLPARVWDGHRAADEGPDGPELLVIGLEALDDGEWRARLVARCAERSPLMPAAAILVGGRASDERLRRRAAGILGLGERCRLVRRPLQRSMFLAQVHEEILHLERLALAGGHGGEALLNRRLGVGLFQVDAGLRRVMADTVAAGHLGTTPAALAATSLDQGPAAVLLPALLQVREQGRPATEILTAVTGQRLPALVERMDGGSYQVLVVDPERADRDLLELQARPVIEQQIAMLRHDLGAPLRRLGLMLELLELGHGPDEGRGGPTLADCRDAVERLGRLMRSGLGGAGAAGDEPCDPTRAVAEVREHLAHRLAEESGSLTLAPLPDALPMPHQDLVRVVQNLVANALRYRSHERAPAIRIEDASGPERLGLAVVDNGIGIDPALIERLFEPYRTGPGAVGRGGTGLGLAICRQLMRRSGGELHATSVPGTGSRFVLTLPRPDGRG